MELTPLQFNILDTLYFVEPFDKIVEETSATREVVADELKTLIAHRLVQVMTFDDESRDYIKSIFYNVDNMSEYYYLATKEGLMRHNGR